MAYITKQDLKDELGADKFLELADDLDLEGTEDERTDKRATKAISYAVGTFDSYARTRYQIPVPLTEQAKAVCLDLAVYHLYKARATDASKESRYAVIKDAHDNQLRWLEKLSAGKVALDVPSAEETTVKPASPDEILRGSSQTGAIFDDTKLSSY
jgi:phage gp36-like protein